MATAPKAAPKVVPIEDGAPASGSGAKKSKKNVLLAALLVLALIGGAAAAYFLVGSEPATDAESVPAPSPALPPVYLQMEQFTVNLQPELGEQYLQVALTLQVPHQAAADQIKLYMPLVRSRLLMLLSSKKASEINTMEGKQKLQEEILAQLREPFAPGLPETSVNGVFFTAFVIQ